MKRFRLLLLDACVVVHLFELGLWESVVDRCDVHLSRIVADREVRFFRGDEADEIIDLSPFVDSGQVKVFDLEVAVANEFVQKFDPVYLQALDDGEAESLAYLMASDQDFLISSADKIVYRVLGRLHRGEQGVSLEEVLQKIGLNQKVARQYSKAYREEWTKRGQQDMICDTGLRKA